MHNLTPSPGLRPHDPDLRFLLRHPAHLLSLGGGAGLSPIAPGTVGTLLAIPVYWFIAGWPAWLYLGAVAALFVVGGAAAGYSSTALGAHDHHAIVVDEIAGMLLGLFHLPGGGAAWAWLMLAFLLFRVFDVLKPWPIDRVDRSIGGGFGIMLDDALAGLWTLAAIQTLALAVGA